MTLKIKDYSLLCNKGSADFNEDIIGFSPYGAWVLDGATGLNNRNLVSRESDARWYVNWWNNYLHENISKKDNLKQIVSEGIEKINKDYANLLGERKAEEIDLPSSSCAILKFHEDRVEYLLLGDCTSFVKHKDKVEVIKDEKLCILDNMVYDAMKKIENVNNKSLKEMKSEVMPILVKNRLKKNKADGYWTLGFSKEAVENSIVGHIDIEDEIKIMLASDGFSCACDRYNLFQKEKMLEVAHNEGIEHIYKNIRDLEESDHMGNKYPRFKKCDDSSCVYLEVYKQ